MTPFKVLPTSLFYLLIKPNKFTFFCSQLIAESMTSSKESLKAWRASVSDFNGSSKQEVNLSTEFASSVKSSSLGPFLLAKRRS